MPVFFGYCGKSASSYHATPICSCASEKPDVSPLLNSPHRRLVEKVFESARSNPSPAITALAQVPALPGDDQNAKLEQVLHSLD